MIGSAGLAVGLLGIVLVYAAGVPSLGDHYTPTYSTLGAAGPHLSHALVYTGFASRVVGFGTKVGLVPMHAWLPDAHSEGPSPISAMLSGALLAAALYAVLRGRNRATRGRRFIRARAAARVRRDVAGPCRVFALRQTNYKRLLAYSSIEHMRIVSLGVGIGEPIAAYGALLPRDRARGRQYVRFFGAGDLLSRYQSRESDDVRGVIRTAPFTGVMVLLAALAIGGVPPFGIFRSELLIVTEDYHVPRLPSIYALISARHNDARARRAAALTLTLAKLGARRSWRAWCCSASRLGASRSSSCLIWGPTRAQRCAASASRCCSRALGSRPR